MGKLQHTTYEDNAELSLLICEAQSIWRAQLIECLSVDVTPDNIVRLMLESEDKWDQIESYIFNVMKTKKKELKHI